MSKSITVKKQDGTMTRQIIIKGKEHTIQAKIRWDDNCGNGHNTFAITGTIWKGGKHLERNEVAWGSIHDDIAKWFPELRKYLKWHGCTSEGPLHYIGNTTFAAGDEDFNGERKGDHCRVRGNLIWHLDDHEGVAFQNEKPAPVDWHPKISEGKEREFLFARCAAIWPEATDEQLSLPKEELTRLLEDRLPALMDEFEKDIKEFGFVW